MLCYPMCWIFYFLRVVAEYSPIFAWGKTKHWWESLAVEQLEFFVYHVALFRFYIHKSLGLMD